MKTRGYKSLFLTLSAALFFSAACMAQGVLKFDNESHDFGEVNEGDQAQYEYKFTNTGDKPVILSNVQASCGCTTPSWTKDPVLPGKTGVITASYNSSGRPGPFTKTVTVTSNATNSPLQLTFRGMVLKKSEIVNYTPEELKKSSKLTLDRELVQLGKIEKDRKNTTRVNVSNKGESTLEITEVQSGSNSTQYVLGKTSVAPGESTTLDLTFTPRNKGALTENIYITTNDKIKRVHKVQLTANVVESVAAQSMMKESKMALPFK
ncbi:MAG: DUF1573 domain-containing protein [Bacteroidota bacterium]